MKFAESYLPGTDFGYEYSPEIFMDTELDFALEICEAVMDVWQPGPGREIMLNLPCTVERSTPERVRRPDRVDEPEPAPARARIALSVHTHNDRGTATADAELAVLAGAERIEGCLFGNGERSGNVDLVTLGAEPVQPGHRPDDRLQRHRRDPPHRRVLHPHRRAPAPPVRGRPGLHRRSPARTRTRSRRASMTSSARQRRPECRSSELPWAVPYLPIDPQDVGRSYEAVIRVNSQSGKGGVAYLMKTDHHLDLPRRLQIEFSHVIQRHTEDEGGEVDAAQMWQIFAGEYLEGPVVRARQVRLGERGRRRPDHHDGLAPSAPSTP